MPNIFNYNQTKLGELFVELGHTRFRADQIMRWIYHQHVLDFNAMQNIPKELRKILSESFVTTLPEIKSEHISQCGTIKWLFNMDEKNAVETVYIPEKNRATLCISSQIGCALACQFCATGLAGFLRNLSTAEIITQVYKAQQRVYELTEGKGQKITNIVFMGMGEPLLNEENVLTAVDILLDDLGFGLSKYRVTVSSSGIVPAIMRFSTRSQAALAISIHAGCDEVRDKIVPINKRYPLSKLLEACDAYTKATKRSITYEYVMLKDVNDRSKDANSLAKLLGHRLAKVNLIPYNPVTGITLKTSELEQIEAFKQRLIRSGIITTVRKTRGDDIKAACGQLFGQVKERNKRIEAYQYIEKVKG